MHFLLVFMVGKTSFATVQPWAGRSENIYLLCKVSLLHPPSSLGLDGEGESLSRYDDKLEEPKEPSSPYSQHIFSLFSTPMKRSGQPSHKQLKQDCPLRFIGVENKEKIC